MGWRGRASVRHRLLRGSSSDDGVQERCSDGWLLKHEGEHLSNLGSNGVSKVCGQSTRRFMRKQQ